MDSGDEAHSLIAGLQTQADLLMRRVQRLQIRMCQRHLHKHMQSFVRREQVASGLGCQLRKVRDNSAHSNGRIQHKSSDPIRFLDRDGVRNMPTSALADIVRGWDTHSLAADSCRLPAPDDRAHVKLSPAGPDPAAKRPVDRAVAEKMECAAGQLRTNVMHLEEDYDSDATESSSGGESCDDGYGLCEPASPAPAFHSAPLTKKQSPADL